MSSIEAMYTKQGIAARVSSKLLCMNAAQQHFQRKRDKLNI